MLSTTGWIAFVCVALSIMWMVYAFACAPPKN
jgi:hypothetical protein